MSAIVAPAVGATLASMNFHGVCSETVSHEIIGTKEKIDELAYRWVTVQMNDNAVPIALHDQSSNRTMSFLEIVEFFLIRLRNSFTLITS